ncbi:laccase [Rickenella mellea]|uniref:Laccase n=1 Tax=Rickenella mellea TaxID=50990 RepID=A0A4Y7Q0L3_9AGAM|nr:laccase [Rickenella mellea]
MCSLSVVLALIPAILGKTVNVDLTIANTQIAPDGFQRSAVTTNGIFPAPILNAQKGDSFNINVHNALSDPRMRQSTSIHWHGLFQQRTSYADGPSFVNQCPIAPNTTFTYAFPTDSQAGTFWYHSHLSTQYCDGLRGALVIRNPHDVHKHLYDVDDDSTVVTLSDYYHDFAPDAQKLFFQTGKVPIPDSVIINGAGRFVGGPLVPWSVINVEHGKRYRLRVINIACRPFYTFSIDGHNLTVIEADGISHEPVDVQNFDIYAAQRYSVVLHANQPVGNYWIRAPGTGGVAGATGNSNLDPKLALAILRYKGAVAEDPTTTSVPGLKLLEQNLHPTPDENPGAPGGSGAADVAITLNIAQPNPPFFDINGISYVSPTVPALLQILSGASKPSDFLPSENMFILPPNKTIEVSIPGAGDHPFHLHGHAFDVIRSANSNITNVVNPPRRDVVAIAGGNVTFRFFSGNAGAWFLHCHIDWHLEAGLAIIFGEAPEENVSGPQAQIIPNQWNTLCPTYDALAPEFQ